MFAVMLRLFQQFKIDSEQGILFNYVTGAIFSLIPVLGIGSDASCLSAENIQLSVFSYRVILTAIQGALFSFGFIVMDWSTWRSGIALTTATARASLILPVVFSWLFLSQPSPSWVAVGLIIVALILIILPNKPQERSEKRSKSDKIRRMKSLFTLVGVFVLFGTSDFSMKIVQHSVEVDFGNGTPQSEQLISILTVCIFVMASIFSFIVCIAKSSFKKHRLSWKAVTGGVILGLINTGCTASILHALACLPTGTFYPIYNIGIVCLATIIGVIFFKEKLKMLQILGLVIAVVAIALAC